jgi:DNA polymerase-3 subunit epsilon
MIVAGLDLETTGLNLPEHRIVEVYVGLWDTGSQARLFELCQRVDPQRSIQPEAQRVHGISAADLIGMPTWDIVGPKIATILAKSEYMVAHNGKEFDGPFLNRELARVGALPYSKPLFDTMADGRWATPLGKLPNLMELCRACDVEYDETIPHAASRDVGVMMECFFRGVGWGFYRPETSVRAD